MATTPTSEVPTTGDLLAEQVQLEWVGVNDTQALLRKLNEANLRQSIDRTRRENERAAELEQSGRDPQASSRGFAEGGADSAYQNARIAELNTKELVQRLKDNPALRPSEATLGGKIIKAIVDNIEDPSLINARSAPYIYSIIQKALTPGAVTNPLDILNPNELNYLKDTNRQISQQVVNALTTAASGIADTDRINQFRTDYSPREVEPRDERQQRFETEEARLRYIANIEPHSEEELRERTDARRRVLSSELYLPVRYFQRPEQVEVMWGLQNAEQFVRFIKDTENAHSAQRTAWGEDSVRWRDHITEEIETKIVRFVDELYVALDESKPTEFFENIAREDYQQGFGVLLTRTANLFRTLPNYINLSNNADVKDYRNRLFKYRVHDLKHTDEERRFDTKHHGEGEKEELMRVVQKYANHPGKKDVGIEDFVRHLGTIFNSESEVREFTHNAKALFYHPVGKEGFYGRLSEFSSKMLTADIDEFLRLPDNDIFMTAYNLYLKFLEEEFAKYDWRHQAGMFELNSGGFNTQMETNVLQMLRQIYQGEHLSLEEKVPEWRLRRALSLGVGASLGIFQSEVEIAANADADKVGQFADIYRNGVAALAPFAPFDFIPWRLAKENTTMADLLFVPVKGIKKRLGGVWDHSKIFGEMNKFKEAYLDRNFDKVDDGVLRLIQFRNFAQAGGPVTRATWRMEDQAVDHLYVYKLRGDRKFSDTLNYLESWKSIENVGFELLFNYERKLAEIFKDPGSHMEDRRELFRYLYTSYIAPGASEGEFESYFRSLESAASRRQYLNDHRDLKPAQSSQEVYRYEVNRALASILKRRIPTKFLRLERGRLVRGGKNARLWDSIQREMRLSSEEFDDTIKDLATAELLHRREISKEMEEWMEHRTGEEKKLNGMSVDYHLTTAKLERLLGANSFGDDRISRARQVLEHLERKEDRAYLDEFAAKLQQRYSAPGTTRQGFTELPYAIAPEEFDMRFFNWRGGGPGVLKRLNDESARVETEIVTLIRQFPQLLGQVASNGKHDFAEIVDALDKMKESMARMAGGVAQPTEMAGHLAAVTIAYFKKDTIARNLLTRAYTIGRPNSLAAEFGGTGRGIWEWEVSDIHKFISALEARRVIPKHPTEMSEIKTEDRKFLGMKFGRKVIREPIVGYSGETLRKDFGAQGKHIFMEIINKYVPLMLAIILMAAIADGVEDALEDVKGKK